MTMTLLSPAAASRIGPGIQLLVQTSIIGPLPAGAIAEAQIFDPVSGLELVRGSAPFGNLSAPTHQSFVTLGLRVRPGFLQQANIGLVDGGTVQLRLNAQNASGGHFDNTNYSGFAWDAVTGLWYLSSNGDDSSIGQILASVRKTY